MTIQQIIGENGVLPSMCKNGMCPAAVLTDDDSVFIQCYQPTPEEGGQLTPPSGEGFVKMPRATFEKIGRQVLNS